MIPVLGSTTALAGNGDPSGNVVGILGPVVAVDSLVDGVGGTGSSV